MQLHQRLLICAIGCLVFIPIWVALVNTTFLDLIGISIWSIAALSLGVCAVYFRHRKQ